MNTETILYATRKGRPDYMEEIITTNPKHFGAARKWAESNGYDRIRVSVIDLSIPPNFANTIQHK
jgi:hypothetical protein